MRQRGWRPWAPHLAFAFCIILACVWLRTHPRMVFFSVSDSMQPGAYLIHRSAKPVRGSIVLACMPEAFGRWALQHGVVESDSECGGTEVVVKRVVAVSGDRVRFSAAGVWINDRRLPGTTRLAQYRHLYAIPHRADGQLTLRSGEYVLIGDERSFSFDSRYFGPVDRVLGTATLKLPLPAWVTMRL